MIQSNDVQPQLIITKRAEGEMLVLQFLFVEYWSSAINLCDLLRIDQRKLLHILRPILKTKLIKGVLQQVMGGEVQLYAITHAGRKYLIQHAVSNTSVDWQNHIPFQQFSKSLLLSARISPTFVPHRLDVQMLRIRAERAGWSGWICADVGQPVKLNQANEIQLNSLLHERQHRPDAWCTDPKGERVCIECERTIKSKVRYASILCDYLLALRRGEFDRVVWVCPEPQLRDKLEIIMTSITHVQIGAVSAIIPRSRFERFKFMSFDEWGA